MSASLLLAAMLALPQTLPAREGARRVVTGTAVISGVVITDAAPEPQPLRKARVTLTSSDLNFNRTIVTDKSGRFTFTSLPAGRFSLSAMKEAYVTMAYGARQPGRPGTSVMLADGERLENLAIRLPRGAVITGTVTDFMGRPIPDVTVAAAQYGFSPTGRRLVGQASGRSDDRGVYRIYGLRPGQYVVSASAERVFLVSSTPDLLQLSEADVDRALQETSPGPADSRLGRPVGYTSIFFPNVTSPDEAAMIPLAAGEERTGIDLQITLVPSGRLEGSVTYSGGALPPVVQVTVVSAARAGLGGLDGVRLVRVNAEGKFQVGALAPGEYVVSARANVPGDAAGQSALWASESVFIDGETAPPVHLDLRPGLTVSGRLDFESDTAPRTDRRGWRVGLSGVGEVTLGVNPAELKPDGTFTLTGVAPGRYRVMVTPPSATIGDAWLPKTAMLGGRNAIEQPVDIVGDVSGVAVTLSDKVAELRGTLHDASGAPASDYHIIVFPVDRALWDPQLRRVQAVRPADNGSYVVKRMAAGQYLLAAIVDVEPGEWLDPAFLERMASAAMPFTLAEGEHKVQDLKLGAK